MNAPLSIFLRQMEFLQTNFVIHFSFCCNNLLKIIVPTTMIYGQFVIYQTNLGFLTIGVSRLSLLYYVNNYRHKKS